jgi:cytoskeleton protein RodZ
MTEEINATYDPLGLKTKRESFGLTLKDVFLNTRISVINLEAIENGKFHELPVPIYTRNFIKTYAGILHIDSKPILDSYEAYLNSQKIEQTKQTEDEPKKEHMLEKIAPYKTYIWTATVIIIVVAVIFFISHQYQPAPEIIPAAPPVAANIPENTPTTASSDHFQTETTLATAGTETNKKPQLQKQPTLPAINNTSAEKPATQQKKPVIAKTAPSVPVAIDEESGLLEITAIEETWLRIKTDQNPPFQILLKPGEKFKREGNEFDVDIGNAGGIKMQFKGKIIENLGKSGQVIHLRLP